MSSRKLLEYFDRPWTGYRKVRKGVKKRIRRHMYELGCTDMDGYLGILGRSTEEKNVCYGCLTVVIGRFFRDQKLWAYLGARVLPNLTTRFPSTVNAWSAGCANGEEPYSLAMLWDRLVPDTSLHIVATDINADCLERARRGIFTRGSIKEVPGEILSRYFTVLPGLKFEVNPILKGAICWRQHDLLTHPQDKGPFHLIFLRNNLLTYHQGPALGRAFNGIVKKLAPGGYLIIGARERLPTSDAPLRQDAQCPEVFQLIERD